MSRPEPALTPDARDDLLRAARYYNSQAPLLGFEFLSEFEETSSLIRESPLLFTLVDPPIRRALLHRFPYGVFYSPGSEDTPDIIVAVVDLQQSPDAVRKAYRR